MPDEIKGKFKEGLGKVTDNEQMEYEGKAEQEAGEAERKVEAAWDRTKGKVKEGVGKLTDDERLEAEGKFDQMKGKIKGQ